MQQAHAEDSVPKGDWPGWRILQCDADGAPGASASPPPPGDHATPNWLGWKSPAGPVGGASEHDNAEKASPSGKRMLGEFTVTCGGMSTPARPQLLLDKAVSRTRSHDSHATITVDFVLPSGVQVGDKVAILHEGRPYRFTVPEGASPGNKITKVLQNKGDSLACSSVELTVPRGCKPGGTMRFQHKGQQYEVAVPGDLKPGQTFMADVSPPTVLFANQDSDVESDPLAVHDPLHTWEQCVELATEMRSCEPALPEPKAPNEEEALSPNVQERESSKAFNCGVGIQLEYDPSMGTLCKHIIIRMRYAKKVLTFQRSGVYNIDPTIECPFQCGDRLTEVNGTKLISNAMLAPSLILGGQSTPCPAHMAYHLLTIVSDFIAASGTTVHLRMIRPDPEGYIVVEGSLPRKLCTSDETILSVKGGNKACGIGVVFDVHPGTGLFFIKRVVQGGSAWVAGALPFPPSLLCNSSYISPRLQHAHAPYLHA